MNIKLKNITKYYNEIPVLNRLNIEFLENETTCIMGPSGSGKTTLLHIIMGLVKPDDGKVEGLQGKKITAVFQENRLCEEIDAIKNVKIVCDKSIKDSDIKQEFVKVGLTDYENKPIAQLSGGMQRRVTLVRALLAKSDVIVMDEPFIGLDEELKEQVIHFVKEKVSGKTLIFVTHVKEEAAAFSAKIVTI